MLFNQPVDSISPSSIWIKVVTGRKGVDLANSGQKRALIHLHPKSQA